MRILILVSTYNGSKYLREQLDSIYRQKGCEISVLVRDDGSTDDTKKILNEYAETYDLKWIKGENIGPANSFIELIYMAPSNYDYYAFCDQDDVWEEDKLLTSLECFVTSKPTIICSNATLCDCNLVELGPVYKSAPKFNFIGVLLHGGILGCTMVINKSLFDLIQNYDKPMVPMHDYYISAMCLAVGGEIIYLPKSTMLYRQHDTNVIGCEKKWYSSLVEKLNLMLNKKNFYDIQELSKLILENCGDIIDTKKMNTLKLVASYKNSMYKRMKIASFAGIGCGRLGLSIAIRLGVLLGKL